METIAGYNFKELIKYIFLLKVKDSEQEKGI